MSNEHNENKAEVRKFLHEISNDFTIAEGFVKCSLQEFQKAGIENKQMDLFLNKGVKKLTELGKKLREFKETSRE